MMLRQVILAILVGVVCHLSRPVLSHARLWEPPGRSTMWRRGYHTPVNYQDNELYCGGFMHQLSLGYKCGVCGDPYDKRRENEAGGKYATGLITRTYTQGQKVTFQIDVTANHKGFFEFKICPTNDPKLKETQSCFDLYPLKLTDGSGTRFKLYSSMYGIVSVNLVLPRDLTCDFCVVQWRYHTGNSWGTDPDGKSCIGCGVQEEFYGCADIKILPSGATFPERKTTVRGNRRTTPHVQTTIAPSTAGTTVPDSSEDSESSEESENPEESGNHVFPYVVPKEVNGENIICRSLSVQNTDHWCQINCQEGNCLKRFCACIFGKFPHTIPRPSGCRAAGGYAYEDGFDEWCRENCKHGNCPISRCVC